MKGLAAAQQFVVQQVQQAPGAETALQAPDGIDIGGSEGRVQVGRALRVRAGQIVERRVQAAAGGRHDARLIAARQQPVGGIVRGVRRGRRGRDDGHAAPGRSGGTARPARAWPLARRRTSAARRCAGSRSRPGQRGQSEHAGLFEKNLGALAGWNRAASVGRALEYVGCSADRVGLRSARSPGARAIGRRAARRAAGGRCGCGARPAVPVRRRRRRTR